MRGAADKGSREKFSYGPFSYVVVGCSQHHQLNKEIPQGYY